MKKNLLFIVIALMANGVFATKMDDVDLLSGCTILSTQFHTEIVHCEGGGQVTETFSAECEMTDVDCYWAKVNADACALGRATLAGLRAQPRMALLCPPGTGPEPGGD